MNLTYKHLYVYFIKVRGGVTDIKYDKFFYIFASQGFSVPSRPKGFQFASEYEIFIINKFCNLTFFDNTESSIFSNLNKLPQTRISNNNQI